MTRRQFPCKFEVLIDKDSEIWYLDTTESGLSIDENQNFDTVEDGIIWD